MKEQEEYFFEPRSITWRKKQTRKDIKIRRHGFWDKGVKKSAQCLSLPPDHFRLHGNWILQAMYFCKTIAIFSRHLSFFFQLILYGNLHWLSFQKIYSLSGFYLKSRLETVRTQSGHLGWDATLRYKVLTLNWKPWTKLFKFFFLCLKTFQKRSTLWSLLLQHCDLLNNLVLWTHSCMSKVVYGCNISTVLTKDVPKTSG